MKLKKNKDGYKRKEFSYSSFCRSFYIPENVNRDKIGASYKDGILSVELPKQEEEKNKITRADQDFIIRYADRLNKRKEAANSASFFLCTLFFKLLGKFLPEFFQICFLGS